MPSEVQVTTISLPRKTKSANDEVILLLEHCLPGDMKNVWLTSNDMDTVARSGGLTKLPERFVSEALKSNQGNKSVLDANVQSLAVNSRDTDHIRMHLVMQVINSTPCFEHKLPL